MNTPIVDFVDKYIKNDVCRFHMPGHKGKNTLGFERYDITEIKGADSLFEASGIIAQSEKNAGRIFGSDCFYSTEGSSLCIRTMLCLLKQLYGDITILAARNAHKAFISACALLDLEVDWLYAHDAGYLSCNVTPDTVENAIKRLDGKNAAIYLTSPDYLGNICDVKAIAQVCKRHDCVLIVDNAHGAYLNFLEGMHPIALGADMCCDSAHKTLPVLTGGAYLHISKSAPEFFKNNAKNAMSLFGSTSPSYLILRSLDAFNLSAQNGYADSLQDTVKRVDAMKERLKSNGFTLIGSEPLKLTLDAKKYGYYGTELADEVRKQGIECEFADKDFTVFMMTPSNTVQELMHLENALTSLPKRSVIDCTAPSICRLEQAVLIKNAVFGQAERVSCEESVGRIVAEYNISCPPAVPIAVCGERINEDAKCAFEYYGIKEITVVKE